MEMASTCVPAAAPPPGYTQSFDNPETKHTTAGIVIAIVGMVITTLFLALRVYTKAFLAHMFGVDDGALVLAWMISIALQIMVVYLWAQETIGVHMWDLCIDEVSFSVLLISVCSILYIPLMALAKFSLLLFYRKISVDRWFRYSVYGIMAFIISYSIALVLSLIFACTPLEKNWDITVTTGHCVNKGKIYLATAGLNAGTDVILLVLPLPMIWQLSVPLVQKIGLACIFGIGSLTLVTSLVRLSLLPPMVSATDTTWAISTPAIWICVEANLVIICGCLPIMRLFFRHVAPRLIGEYPETAASKPSSRGKRPINSVAELSNLDGTQRPRPPRQYGRLSEWDEFWEKDLGEDAGSDEICTVDSSGRIVAATKPAKTPSRTPSKSNKRLSVPTWFGGQPQSQSQSQLEAGMETPPPPPSYVVGRNDDGRYSLKPSAG